MRELAGSTRWGVARGPPRRPCFISIPRVGASDILPHEVALGTAMVLLVIEACRRSLSRWMAVTISLALVYLATCQWFRGAFHYKGFTYPRMIELLYLGGDDGMYGFRTGISSNILFIYVLFGAVLMKAGVGSFLIALAERTTGALRGGPARTAVVGSALFGTISAMGPGGGATAVCGNRAKVRRH